MNIYSSINSENRFRKYLYLDEFDRKNFDIKKIIEEVPMYVSIDNVRTYCVAYYNDAKERIYECTDLSLINSLQSWKINSNQPSIVT